MVYIFLAPGFEIAEALVPCDILLRAGAKVQLVSITKELAVRSAQGVTVLADTTIEKLNGAVPHMIVLPGGMPGAQNLRESALVCQYLLDADLRGNTIGAICAAPFILGELGLLKGKKATCYPGFENHLEGATFVGGKVAIDKNIITASGMGAAQQFGYALAVAYAGREKANAVMKQIMAE